MQVVTSIGVFGYLSIIGAIITAIGTFFLTVRRDSKAVRTVCAAISLFGALTSACSGLLGAFAQATSENAAELHRRKIENISEALRDEMSRNAKLSKLIVDLQTGGDGFIRLAGFLPNYPCAVGLFFENMSNYPLYDMHVEVADLNAPDILDGRTEFDAGNLPPGKHYLYDRPAVFGVCEKKTMRLNVFFSARNGDSYQEYRADYRGRTAIATRVISGGRVLFENVDEGYPRLQSGEPDWELSGVE